MACSYRKGRSAEQYIKKKSLEEGATLVIRSAKSKGPVDLVSIDSEKKVIELIQVKRGKQTPTLVYLESKYAHLLKLRGEYTVVVSFVVKKGCRYDKITYNDNTPSTCL